MAYVTVPKDLTHVKSKVLFGLTKEEKQKSIFNVSFILHLVISFIIAILLIIAGYFF